VNIRTDKPVGTPNDLGGLKVPYLSSRTELLDNIRRSLSRCVDSVGERTPGKARLAHDVVFLGNAERRLTQIGP
jgi:hypothetical protein